MPARRRLLSPLSLVLLLHDGVQRYYSGLGCSTEFQYISFAIYFVEALTSRLTDIWSVKAISAILCFLSCMYSGSVAQKTGSKEIK